MNLTPTAFRRIWIALIAVLVLAIVVGSLLTLPGPKSGGILDKAEHFLAYFSLALLGTGIVPPKRLWLVLARSFLLGTGLEALQMLFTADRFADWADVLANGLGIAGAWLIARDGRAGWARHVQSWLTRRQAS